ncbi:MAG: FAD-binding protein [Proteobacteria bacterium]|nr:FAD-binding protein [Pseudomonadota bacterium]
MAKSNKSEMLIIVGAGSAGLVAAITLARHTKSFSHA